MPECKHLSDDFDERCVNPDCPYCTEWCPCTEHPEICKFFEEEQKMNFTTENTTLARDEVVPISAILDETDAAMSEAIAILKKLLCHITNEGVLPFDEKENAQCMKEFTVLMSHKARALMEGLAKLSAEIGA